MVNEMVENQFYRQISWCATANEIFPNDLTKFKVFVCRFEHQSLRKKYIHCLIFWSFSPTICKFLAMSTSLRSNFRYLWTCVRTFNFKIIAEWNICTDLYPKITLSQSECPLMSHDFMLSVQMIFRACLLKPYE